MPSRPSVAIIGGGIGGLFAANALIAQGLRVSVYEQASALGEVGAGVFVTPNAVRQLERVGLGPAVETMGRARWAGLLATSVMTERRSPRSRCRTRSGWNAAFGMHRADFVDFLAANLPAGIVHTGHRAIGFEQNDDAGPRRIRQRRQRRGRRRGRRRRHPLRTAARTSARPRSPSFTAPFPIAVWSRASACRTGRWIAGRCGPVRPGTSWSFRFATATMVNYVGFVPTDEEMKESWSAPGDPEVLRREFEGWDPRIGEVLQQVDKTFRWALYDREPLPTWSTGRLTLLGDAAHPMLPHLGQGANQAIEDGMALATILAQVDASAVPAALLAYERLRRERVAEIQLGARQNGLRLDSAAADLSVARRTACRARRIPQAPLFLRRGAGCARRGRSPAAIDRCRCPHDRLHLTMPVFLAISPTRLSSARISPAVCSGVA